MYSPTKAVLAKNCRSWGILAVLAVAGGIPRRNLRPRPGRCEGSRFKQLNLVLVITRGCSPFETRCASPTLITIMRDPRTGRRSVDNNWDFWTLRPKALRQVTIIMFDRPQPHAARRG
jgi:hypothetical protein